MLLSCQIAAECPQMQKEWQDSLLHCLSQFQIFYKRQ
nr:MAG TPA: hypothetical protein [Caudoviricetes sp.]